jgi:hypothetical protein
VESKRVKKKNDKRKLLEQVSKISEVKKGRKVSSE